MITLVELINGLKIYIYNSKEGNESLLNDEDYIKMLFKKIRLNKTYIIIVKIREISITEGDWCFYLNVWVGIFLKKYLKFKIFES